MPKLTDREFFADGFRVILDERVKPGHIVVANLYGDDGDEPHAITDSLRSWEEGKARVIGLIEGV